ncbi:unnamed protein product, partial [Prunus brigantina]
MKATHVLVYGDSQLVASGVNIPDSDHDSVIRIEKQTLPTLAERGMTTQVSSAEITDE